MITYSLLQHYWWFLVSLLAGLLVFLLFVQGANSFIFVLGRNEAEQSLIVNSTGRKWELTFTTLVTFGGAFFASFPLFYSTSFGGAYWLWMLILFSFILQAVAYEFQSKPGNIAGRRGYRCALVLNGMMGPLLLGMAVSTLLEGADFVVEKGALTGASLSPVISRWDNAWHGLDAFANPWNIVAGLTILFLARTLGLLYLINNISDDTLRPRLQRRLRTEGVAFVALFLTFAGRWLTKDGIFFNPETALMEVQSYHYAHNLMEMPAIAAMCLTGVALVLFGWGKSVACAQYHRGIWPAGIGTVLTVLSLLLTAGFNHTAYYPSTADLQSSLTIANSCSSEFTLRVMAVVSLLIPFVLAYIAYTWRIMDRRSLTKEELEGEEHKY